jgi:hypothetical protein
MKRRFSEEETPVFTPGAGDRGVTPSSRFDRLIPDGAGGPIRENRAAAFPPRGSTGMLDAVFGFALDRSGGRLEGEHRWNS